MQTTGVFLSKVKPLIMPVLVMRRAVMEANLAAMQAACAAWCARLRAHGKMHNFTALGREQLRLDAVGL